MPQDSLTRTLRDVFPNDPVTAQGQMDVIRSIRELSSGVRPPTSLDGPGTFAGVTAFFVVSVDSDFLVCRIQSDEGTQDNDGDTVFVVKPYLLRNSITSRNGITFTYSATDTRQADDGATTEDQVVVPSYVAGDIIYAVPVDNGLASVTAVAADGSTTPEYLDLNVDGRAWAATA